MPSFNWCSSFSSGCFLYIKIKKNYNKIQSKDELPPDDTWCQAPQQSPVLKCDHCEKPFPLLAALEFLDSEQTPAHTVHPVHTYFSSSPFNNTISLSRVSGLQSMQTVNSKLINNGAITMVHTKAEGVGGSSLHKRKKRKSWVFHNQLSVIC